MKPLQKVTVQGFKKKVYKFVDGKRTATFDGLETASKDAGISHSALGLYISGRKKKPLKIPSNVEYSSTSQLLPKQEDDEWQ